ncbi:MAG: 3-mercaptopyruvate sulfurtransferase [Rhodospirillales bacterium]|nr:3-mercaptopyruvate sulfurtransferase [Rhodospirillales bacterium]MCW8861812.1 3-mercaptopyruvate sulfurtransferase [Rhodospirillales bacterium]MCW8970786.1 3-mercaptopyruvate sulfurtransferase [Rhodospirillales bacterium]MCW9040528.1 3-mercaptopyruvate sulfurtransferase [Rhodospirillales bacterium]
MNYANAQALVDTQWLEDHLGDENLKVIDATWFLPTQGRDAEIEHELRHIPGAVWFNIDDIADDSTDLPHMVPDATVFAEKVGKLGIGNNDTVVVYDALGGFCAAHRVWWMFRLFGHDNVMVLDGGLIKWTKEQRQIDKGVVEPSPEVYEPIGPDVKLLRDLDLIRENIVTKDEQLIDARSERRFAGIDHEPRPTERRGHIPGSINIPFTTLMNAKEDWTFRSADQIREIFEGAGVDLSQPIATTCGSGVTACTPAFALFLLGIEIVPVYDGSWAEWGDRDDTPIVS